MWCLPQQTLHEKRELAEGYINHRFLPTILDSTSIVFPTLLLYTEGHFPVPGGSALGESRADRSAGEPRPPTSDPSLPYLLYFVQSIICAIYALPVRIM